MKYAGLIVFIGITLGVVGVNFHTSHAWWDVFHQQAFENEIASTAAFHGRNPAESVESAQRMRAYLRDTGMSDHEIDFVIRSTL